MKKMSKRSRKEQQRFSGSITLYLSLILTVVIALVCTIVESARVHSVNAKINGVTYTAADSVLGEYAREVFDEYGIMMYWNSGIEDDLSQYINSNLEINEVTDYENTDLYGVSLSEIEITNLIAPTDENGEEFLNQITEYMKYQAVEDSVEWLLEQFNVYEDKSSEDNVSSDTAESLEEYETEIFDVAEKLSDKLVDFGETVADGQELLDKALEEEIGSEKFEKKFKKVLKNINKLDEMCDDISDICDEYEEEKEKICSSSESISDELVNDSTVSDVSGTVSKIKKLIKKLDESESEEESEETYEEKIELAEQIYELSDGIAISETDDSDDTINPSDLLDYVKDIINNGILAVATDDVSSISTSVISTDALPSVTTEYDSGSSVSISDTALLTYYQSANFGNYANALDGTALTYELEYILSGSSSDKENLTKAVEKIVAVREVFNIAYLMADSTKRTEAYELALACTTALGVPVLAVVAQGIIMAAWALGESIVDVRTLMQGGRVPLVKTSDTWNLALSKITSLGEGITTTSEEESSSGLTYENYLQILMLLQNQTTGLYRTMDLIQANMQKNYNSGFKLSDCVLSYDFTAEYSADSIFVSVPFVRNLLGISGDGYMIKKSVSISY